MKTTLIYPGISGMGFNSLGKGMDGGWVSHGLCSISASAKAQGLHIDLIDLRAISGWEQFRKELEQRRPQVVGVTMMSVDYNPGMRAVELVKEVDPSIIVIVGGAHASIMPDDVLSNPLVDYVVTGEGEITFPRLLKTIGEGNLPSSRLQVGIHPDLDAIPFADRDLFLQEWRNWGYGRNTPEVTFCPELPEPFATIIAGRGCRYNCSFCMPAEHYLFGKGTHRRSVDNVIQEIICLKEQYGVRSFMFHDDCLTEDRAWVGEFCQKYQETGLNLPFFCQSRADIISLHEDMVKMMRDVGLVGYFIGFESGNDRVLRFLRKGTTRARNLQAAAVCKKYGIKIWANYMMGIPTETEGEVMDTISMLKIIDPDYYSPSFYTPHPGTDLYDYTVEGGLSLISDFDSYRRNPTEPKIKGQDYEFLAWAVGESQRRTLKNRVRRAFRTFVERYGSPAKLARKARNRYYRHILRRQPPEAEPTSATQLGMAWFRSGNPTATPEEIGDEAKGIGSPR